MKRRKSSFGVLVGMILLAVSILSGCGGRKVTAESLMKEVEANMEKVESMSMNMKLEMGMAIKESGMSMDMDVTGDIDLEVINDPVGVYLKGKVSMSLMGISLDMESYSVEENGKLVTYTSSMGEWTRTEEDMPEKSQMDSVESVFDSKYEYTLNDKTEKADGKEVYVLTTQISGDLMQDVMGMMSEDMDDLYGDMDWSEFSADITVKIDKSTRLPVEMTMDCGEGMSNLMDSMTGTDDTEVSIDTFSITYTFLGFDDVEEIKVPDDVKEAAENGEESENGSFEDFLGEAEDELENEGLAANADGTYTLKEYAGDGAVNIGVPEGYAISPYSDETFLGFHDTAGDDNDIVYLSYFLGSGRTEEELVSSYDDTFSYYEEDDDYSNLEVQDVKKVQTSKGEAGYVKASYTYDEDSNYVEYYCWMFLDDTHVLECTIEENAYQKECALIDEATILETVFSVVEK